MMTLQRITDILSDAGIAEAKYEALILAEAVTGKSRAVLLCNPNVDISSKKLEKAVYDRCKRIPLQYVLGTWEFMGLPFEVSPDCLIPRADTELLCEWAINRLPKGGSVLDLCTGSGCVAISIAHYRPDAKITAVELYPATLDIARRNGYLSGMSERVTFISADATSHEDAKSNFAGTKFDIIVSNPPYITADEMADLMPELSHEPRSALTDEGDGLSFYKAITEVYPDYLAPNGACAFEHGFKQGEAVREIIAASGYKAETLRDLSGKDRVTFFEKKNIIY